MLKRVAEMAMRMERVEEEVKGLRERCGEWERKYEEGEGKLREMERKLRERERKIEEREGRDNGAAGKGDEGRVRENKYDSEEARKIRGERERGEARKSEVERDRRKGEKSREEEVQGRKARAEEEESKRRKRAEEEEKRRRKRERSVVVRGIGEVGKGGEVARRVLEARGVLTEEETVKGMGVKWGKGGAVVVIELCSREEVGRVLSRKRERLKGTRIFVNKDRTYEQREREREREREDRRRNWSGGRMVQGGT